jgi:hypothetical protein
MSIYGSVYGLLPAITVLRGADESLPAMIGSAR